MKQSTKILLLATLMMSVLGSAQAQSRSQDTQSQTTTPPSRQAGSPTQHGSTGMTSQSSRTDSTHAQRQHRFSKVIGADVRDAQGAKIGSIKDVLVDPARGQVNYAVVSFGGTMGIGSKYIAVPWRALQSNMENETYVLNTDKDTLKNAPSFERDKWPDMSNDQWSNDIDRYWQSKVSSLGSPMGTTASARNESSDQKRSTTTSSNQ